MQGDDVVHRDKYESKLQELENKEHELSEYKREVSFALFRVIHLGQKASNGERVTCK